jgi:uncharacterized protein
VPSAVNQVTDACLVLMFKAPARSKRRLAGTIGAQADELAARLFDCACEDLGAWAGPVCFAPAEAADAAWLSAAIGAQPLVVLQGEGNLGRRINRVNAALEGAGLARQIFLGIDCPVLDAAYLAEATAALGANDLVIGPAVDGGAVLIATRRLLPALEALPWSTAALGAALQERVDALGWRHAVLQTRADIDTLQDLATAAAALEADPRPARIALRRCLEQVRGAAR